jgi:hypothetical protein
MWYPLVEPKMNNLIITDKRKLVKYVMHAKHSKITAKADKLQEILGEEFEEICEEAEKGFSKAL